MTDKKKKYLTPQMTVVEIEKADIIATSGGYNSSSVLFNGGNDLLLDEDNF